MLTFSALLADRIDVTVGRAIPHALAVNERRYSVTLARGNAQIFTGPHGP